jgi:hypothetical protein
VEVAGVKINFSMPHVESIGLGGGSIVRLTDRSVSVGPDSVGHYFSTKAKVFGGNVLTATDIAVSPLECLLFLILCLTGVVPPLLRLGSGLACSGLTHLYYATPCS